jgi:hypothetical protein
MRNKMKKSHTVILVLALSQGMALAALTATNRLSISARIGFNIDAGFSHSYGTLGGGRTTPDGDPYNYDDGYVYPDVAATTETWYWGYDDAGQIVGTDILMSRTVSTSGGMNDMEGSTPTVGAELTYSHMLEFDEKYRFGLDFSVGFIPLDFEEHGQVTALNETTTDRYALLGGPGVPGAPYEGTFLGAGYLISTTPNDSTVSYAPGETYDVDSELQGFLWSTRIGPFLEYPLGEHLNLHMALGLSLGILDVDAEWQTSGSTPESGGGHDAELLTGGFIGADVYWEFEEDWHIGTGLEFEYLNDWEQDFGNGTYALDFTRMYYLNIGLMHEF